MKNIEGILVPILTPITEDENPRYDQLEKLVDYVIEGGVNAIFANGTTGEFARFTERQRSEVVEKIVESAAGRVPVLAGISDCGTKRVLENLKRAEAAGADAVVTTLPYYFPTTSQKEQIEFITDIAVNSPLPVLFYNIPAVVGTSISRAVLDEVCDLEQLYGIKDTSGDPDFLLQLIENYGDKLKVFVGHESLSLFGFKHGAAGLVPSMANPFPKILSGAWNAARKQDWEACERYCSLVDEMNHLNASNESWMSPNIWRKEALSQMGIMDAAFTRPYNPVDEETKSKIAEWIAYYKENFE